MALACRLSGPPSDKRLAGSLAEEPGSDDHPLLQADSSVGNESHKRPDANPTLVSGERISHTLVTTAFFLDLNPHECVLHVLVAPSTLTITDSYRRIQKALTRCVHYVEVHLCLTWLQQ